MAQPTRTPRLSPRLAALRHLPLRKQRFALLFAFLLLSLLVYPYAESSTLGFFAFRLLSSCIVVLIVYALALRRGLSLELKLSQ